MTVRRIPAMIILLCVLLPVSISADSSPTEAEGVPITLSISYFGEMVTHPGASIDLELALYTGSSYSLWLSNKIGWYVHIRNHHGLFFLPGIVNRVSAPGGFFVEGNAGVGYFGRITDGTVYTGTADGTIIDAGVSYSSKLVISVSFVLGYDFYPAAGIPVSLYLEPGVFAEYPYNGYFLPHLSLESGIRLLLSRSR